MSLEQLTKIFRETFENDALELTEETGIRAIKNWDSFNHINLMLALEAEFGVTILPVEVEKMKSVGAVIQVLRSKGCTGF